MTIRSLSPMAMTASTVQAPWARSTPGWADRASTSPSVRPSVPITCRSMSSCWSKYRSADSFMSGAVARRPARKHTARAESTIRETKRLRV